MFGSNKRLSASRSEFFYPILNTLVNDFNRLSVDASLITQMVLQQNLNDLKSNIANQNPELAKNVQLKEQDGKLTFTVGGDTAQSMEYGEAGEPPQGYVRKAAEKTTRDLQQVLGTL